MQRAGFQNQMSPQMKKQPEKYFILVADETYYREDFDQIKITIIQDRDAYRALNNGGIILKFIHHRPYYI